jgi:hypothetical protein
MRKYWLSILTLFALATMVTAQTGTPSAASFWFKTGTGTAQGVTTKTQTVIAPRGVTIPQRIVTTGNVTLAAYGEDVTYTGTTASNWVLPALTASSLPHVYHLSNLGSITMGFTGGTVVIGNSSATVPQKFTEVLPNESFTLTWNPGLLQWVKTSGLTKTEMLETATGFAGEQCNGQGNLGTNECWTRANPPITFDGSDAPDGSRGHFRVRQTIGVDSFAVYSSKRITIDTSRAYEFTWWYKLFSAPSTLVRYLGAIFFDADNIQINGYNHMRKSGSVPTTLSRALSTGDTQIWITAPCTGWDSATASERSISFNGYKNAQNRQFVDNSYTRWFLTGTNAYSSAVTPAFTELWNAGSVTTVGPECRIDTINPIPAFPAEWTTRGLVTAGAIPAGTGVWESSNGATFKYFGGVATWSAADQAWQKKTAVIQDVDYSGLNVTNKIPPGVASMSPLILGWSGTQTAALDYGFTVRVNSSKIIPTPPDINAIQLWTSSNPVVANEFRKTPLLGGAVTAMTSNSIRTTGATTFTLAEAANWSYVSQQLVPQWAASSLVLTGFQVVDSSGITWQANTTRTTGSGVFDATEKLNWTALSPAVLDTVKLGLNVPQTAHGFVLGDVIQKTSSVGIWAKAQANSAAGSDANCVVQTVPDANNFACITFGLVTGLSGLTEGSWYYLSSTVAGAYTVTAPSASGTWRAGIFKALSSTTGLVSFQPVEVN